MAATLKQIAGLTGLSIPTVHQILNNYSAPFAEETRKRVLAVAAELNYRPNIAARSLVTQRSFLVGVLFYGANYPLVTPFMRGVQATVKGERVLADLPDPQLAGRGGGEPAGGARSGRVDGLIVNVAIDAAGTTNAERLAAVRAGGTPVVEVFGQFVPGVPRVTLDYRAAARAATEQLVAAGHERIALLIREQYQEDDPHRIGGRFWIATEFWHGYQGVIRSAGLEPLVTDYPVEVDNTNANVHFRGAAQVVPSLFTDPATAPTAVVCYSVEAADAAIRCYERLGEAFDGPLTVAAFGTVRPALSDRINVMSFPLPAEQAGRLAAAAVFDQLAGRPATDHALGPAVDDKAAPDAVRPARIATPPRRSAAAKPGK